MEEARIVPADLRALRVGTVLQQARQLPSPSVDAPALGVRKAQAAEHGNGLLAGHEERRQEHERVAGPGPPKPPRTVRLQYRRVQAPRPLALPAVVVALELHQLVAAQHPKFANEARLHPGQAARAPRSIHDQKK